MPGLCMHTVRLTGEGESKSDFIDISHAGGLRSQ